MVIWWGTKFYGKKNMRTKVRTCKFCGSEHNISSFDARKFFYLYSIPLIPLGKFHVLDHCNGCDRLIQIPEKKWNILKVEEYEKVRSAYASAKNNQEAAVAFHAATVLYRSDEEAESIALTLEHEFANNADVQSYLAEWYLQNANEARAADLFERVVTASPDNEFAKFSLGGILTRRGDLLRAKELFLRIQSLPDDTDYMLPILTLAGLLLDRAQPREAFGLVQFIQKNFPRSSVTHKNFRALTKRIEKKLGAAQTILPPNPAVRRSLIFLGSMASIVAVVFFGLNYYLSLHQEVYIVNGLSERIELKLPSGETLGIVPGSAKKKDFSEGEHTVTIKNSTGEFSLKVSVHEDFFDRFEPGRHFVLNPAGSAVLAAEEVIYTTNPSGAEVETGYALYTGKELEVLSNIDYLFQIAPREIRMNKNGVRSVKWQITVLKEDKWKLLGALYENEKSVTPARILSFMEGRITVGERDGAFLNQYQVYCQKQATTPQRCVDFMRKIFPGR